jgi:hypothetical protein
MYIISLENEKLNLFNNAHHYLINNDFSLSTSNSFLEILIDNDTYIITDETQIKQYRTTDSIPAKEYIKKYTTYTKSIDSNEDYNYAVTIKDIEIEEIKNFENDITNDVKQFQMKKELIYKSKKVEDVWYKCEIITNSIQYDKCFKNIALNTKSPKYVYSIISDKKIDEDYYIRKLHFILDSNIIPLKKTEQTIVINEYMTLIKSMKIFSTYAKLDDNVVMFAPKPATLEKHNLISIEEEEYGVTSIFDNYAVTEKADGLRFLLYINNKSKAFLIETSSKQVRGCNIVTTLKNCLLDGELILCQNRLSSNNSKDLFAIFDIYYYNDTKTTNLPLLADTDIKSRYNYMNDFVGFISTFNSHDIIVKKQLTSDNILNNCNYILFNNNEYDYHIDGLIFTPTKIPILGAYSNKPVVLDNINNFSWNKVLKWKPPEQNTIDFIVIEIGKYKSASDGKTYKEYSLNVVFNNMDMEPISVVNGLQYMQTQGKSLKAKLFDKSIYSLRQFTIDDIPQFVYIETYNNKNKCFTEENEEILNNSVVEFSYDSYSIVMSNKKRWKPLRIRHDKNNIYNFGLGELKLTANSYFVAMNIWRSITNEVSMDMICGKQPININIKKYLTGLDVYYKRSISSNNLISKTMNYFHNHIIKSDLYKVHVTTKNKALLELACGQASDLNRWIVNRFTNVLGIDYTLDNITNAKAGAYSRFLNTTMSTTTYSNTQNNMIFVAGDCSRSIRNGKASDNIDNESKELLQHLFINNKQSKFSFIKQFPKTFDVVSCMFSVHYFFENEKMLNGFIQNVGENIAQNGKFILTFMDKNLVKKILEPEGKAVGKDPVSNATVWAIIGNYNPNQTDKYNQKIDVFIENTGRLISENLVDLNILIVKLSRYGIKLIKTQTFEETFNDRYALFEELEDSKTGLTNSQIREKTTIYNLKKDKNLQRFSFLNRWCIFEKT